jgi:hypothetical protein
MDWNTNFDQFSRQLSELQRGLFNSWASSMPNMQSSNTPNFRETFDKSLRFQEQMVTSSLELQAMVARLSIEAQKQFWQSYFNTLRKP